MGYHRFQTNQPVGSIQLHVTSRRPLLVTEYALADTLISGDRAEVLGDLILCAEAVARQLHQSRKIGNGCLEWQLDPGPYEGVCRLFPDFKPARKRNPLKRGKKYLRSCP